ncbi:uncharacterized protein PHACADRAFT_146899 [Phanerochaete carnosa HHB-10118-sp]|uniref:Uncharacterized protein n=1 Tax=Phanerochaete carnosa (strain HHB-10118-sp) TaxID=650164 RepID=K5WW59_PHACS|nr:uncharacterized protein PHACADRAFT_146899 [Phanerochaete carnosa HHB-10118-sp]EKM54697.1 hypothetical protein PHACADRAFT_146899 [Phanerochaete carnosa HHB-10118-sp]
MLLRLSLRRVRNRSYQHPRFSIMGPHEHDHLFFSSGGVQGINLANARTGQLENLDECDEDVFPATFAKVTVLITLHGYEVYRRVKNVQRVRGGVPLPVQRSKLVRCIAEAMQGFINQARPTSDHDGAFAFGLAGIQMEHLYLLEIHRYGKTLVPVLGYVPPGIDLAVTVRC